MEPRSGILARGGRATCLLTPFAAWDTDTRSSLPCQREQGRVAALLPELPTPDGTHLGVPAVLDRVVRAAQDHTWAILDHLVPSFCTSSIISWSSAPVHPVLLTEGHTWLCHLPCAHLTHQPLLPPLRRPKPRPIIHSHLTKQAAVARATAGKVLASRCARQGQSTRTSQRVAQLGGWRLEVREQRGQRALLKEGRHAGLLPHELHEAQRRAHVQRRRPRRRLVRSRVRVLGSGLG